MYTLFSLSGALALHVTISAHTGPCVLCFALLCYAVLEGGGTWASRATAGAVGPQSRAEAPGGEGRPHRVLVKLIIHEEKSQMRRTPKKLRLDW